MNKKTSLGLQTERPGANPSSREVIESFHFLRTPGALLEGSREIGLAQGTLSKRICQDSGEFLTRSPLAFGFVRSSVSIVLIMPVAKSISA